MSNNTELTEETLQSLLQGEENSEASPFVHKILSIILRKWYWFLISAFICVSIGTYKYMCTTPLYSCSAQLLIKNDQDKSQMTSLTSNGEYEILGNNANINNELYTLKAPVLMNEVAARLHLDQTVSYENGLKRIEFYKDAPVSFDVVGVRPESSYSFTAVIKSSFQIKLSNFVVNGKPVDRTMVVPLDKTVQTPIGLMTISRTFSFSNSFDNNDLYVNKIPVEAAGGSFAGRLSVEISDEKSSVVNLKFVDENTKRANDVLLTLIDVYNENWIKDKNRVAVATSEFINDRLSKIEKDLGSVDKQISNFKSANLLPDVEAAATNYMTAANDNQKQFNDLSTQLAIAKEMIAYAHDGTKRNKPLPLNVGINNASIENQVAAYNNLLLEREKMGGDANAQNITVIRQDRDIATARNLIIRSLENLSRMLQKQIADTRGQENATNQKLAANPQKANELQSINRQQKVKESLYIYLLQKREENELSKAYTSSNSRIIQPPMGGGKVAPQGMRMLLMSLIIGLLIPAAILIIKVLLDNKVKVLSDLEQMKVPVIGQIPLYEVEEKVFSLFSLLGIPKKKKHHHTSTAERTKIVVKENTNDDVNEAFRILRTKIDFMTSNGNQDAKTYMVTSLNPGSGKTFITFNLALCIALKNKRVLAIDLDLRRMSLSRYVNKPQLGLSNYLADGEDNIDELIIKGVSNKNLDILPGGTIPPNPTELLLNGRFDALLLKLREEYDYILFDCPPFEIIADPEIIKRWADVTFFIIRANLLNRRALPAVDKLYTENQFPNMGVILNGTSRKDEENYGYYRYGYYGGYKYTYKYRYGSEK